VGLADYSQVDILGCAVQIRQLLAEKGLFTYLEANAHSLYIANGLFGSSLLVDSIQKCGDRGVGP